MRESSMSERGTGMPKRVSDGISGKSRRE